MGYQASATLGRVRTPEKRRGRLGIAHCKSFAEIQPEQAEQSRYHREGSRRYGFRLRTGEAAFQLERVSPRIVI